MSRFLVGIDLGTTNSALSWVDTFDHEKKVFNLDIPQYKDQKHRVSSEILPSFVYIPTKKQRKEAVSSESVAEGEGGQSFRHWVGLYARELLQMQPDRVVSSAKSWLCHNGVDRHHKLLPWGSETLDVAEKLSPVEAMTEFLKTLRDTWNEQKASFDEQFRLEKQDITLAVPASFDEVASRLTLQAAHQAGFEHVRLIEEPQAAFYDWMYRDGIESAQKKRKAFLGAKESATLLVCDIGGGTTDMSLLRLHHNGDVERLAVSDHILLGGDNFDQALAHQFESSFAEAGGCLQGQAWSAFIAQCRMLKEQALSENEDVLKLSVSTGGSKLFGKVKSIQIPRDNIINNILSGFFPECDRDFRFKTTYRAGLQEWGLPYAEDPAISRHLAHFLNGRHIDGVLYTGGTLKPSVLRQKITEYLSKWQETDVVELDTGDMDLAVSRGASWHGASARGFCGQIRSGYARSLYVEVLRPDRSKAALCVVPRGVQQGQRLKVEVPGLQVRLGEPVRFRLLSSVQAEEVPGEVVDIRANFTPLAPLETVLKHSRGARGLVDAHLEVDVMDTGLLKVLCVHKDESWELEFVTRAHFEWENHFEHAVKKQETAQLKNALNLLQKSYGKANTSQAVLGNPQRLVRDLEQIFAHPRTEWDVVTLRSLWPTLSAGLNRRHRSEKHEHAWLQLSGLALRPGFGVEFDEFRVADASSILQAGVKHKTPAVMEQWWIFWRRLAGGLTREQQNKLFDKAYPLFLKKQETPEMIRCFGAFERMDADRKKKLGSKLLQDLKKESYRYSDAAFWALARLASRTLLHAGPENIVLPELVVTWWSQLQKDEIVTRHPKEALFFLSWAARSTGDRYFDLPVHQRQKILAYMRAHGAHVEYMKRVSETISLSRSEQFLSFGEDVPVGLSL